MVFKHSNKSNSEVLFTRFYDDLQKKLKYPQSKAVRKFSRLEKKKSSRELKPLYVLSTFLKYKTSQVAILYEKNIWVK